MINLKKKIGFIAIIAFIITFFATTVNAGLKEEREAFWQKEYKAIGTKIGVIGSRPFNLHEFETYCVHHHSGSNGGDYTVHYYIEIDGDVAKRYDQTGKVTHEWKDKVKNGALAYILEEEGWRKSSRFEDSDPEIDKNAGLESERTMRNQAIWYYMPTWMGKDATANGAIGKLDIDPYWKPNKTYDSEIKSKKWYKEMLQFVERAENYAGTMSSPTVTASSKTVNNVQEEKSIVGPFKFNYTGDSLSVEVYNTNDKKLSNVEFFEDRKCTKKIENVKSGKEFYIKVNSNSLIKNVKVKAKGTTIKAKLWFLAYDSDFKKNSGQELMIVKSSKDIAESDELVVNVEYNTGDLKIVKVDKETGEKLPGVQFKIHCEKGWIQEKTDKDGNYTYLSDKKEGFKTAKVFTTDKNGEVLVQNLLALTKGYKLYEVGALKEKGYFLEDQTDSQKGYKYYKSKDYVAIDEAVFIKPYQTTPVEIKITNKSYETGSLKIVKQDKTTGEKLRGAVFKIYAVEKGWLQEKTDPETGKYVFVWDKNGGFDTAKEIQIAASGEAVINNLPILEKGYRIYETKAPDGNYHLEEQDDSQKGYKYHKSKDYVAIDEVIHLKEGTTTPIEITVTNMERPTGDLKIVKQDEATKKKLAGAKFKVYAIGKGWLQKDDERTTATGKVILSNKVTFKLDNSGGYETAFEFITDDNGEMLIENLPVLEKGYNIYETKPPKDYELSEQANTEKGYEYNAKRDWLKINEVIKINEKETSPVELVITNSDNRVDNLEGMVWGEKPDGKENPADSIYTENSTDYLIKEGIKVYLKSISDNKDLITNDDIAEDENGHYVTTDENGHYKFENLNLKYTDLENAYVEFKYDNDTYILVEPLVGTDASVNSKAKEKILTKEKLNDEEISKKQNTKAYPGVASTELTKGTLTKYYDKSTHTVSNINLGLKEKLDGEHSIYENLAYVKIVMNNYTYTYKAGDSKITENDNITDETIRKVLTAAPTINVQNLSKTFGAKIYPSDVAYNVENNSSDLKVYVVYSIDVTNTNTHNYDNQFVEQKLYLNTLTSKFDLNKYELSKDTDNTDDKNISKDFALWQEDKDSGIARYDVNNNLSPYKEGIGKNEIKTSYIQYRMKEDMVRTILTKKLTEEDLATAPTVTESNGYHEYLRTDYVWNDNNITAFDGVKGTNYPAKNAANKKYYVHRTKNEASSSANVFVRFSLSDIERTIKGKVYEDTATQESLSANEYLGNGIIDDAEKNRAKGVKVELLDVDGANKGNPTNLYRLEAEKDENDNYKYKIKNGVVAIEYQENNKLPKAETVTSDDGTYEFRGVVPGYYMIRFTYSDGTQKMMDASGVAKDITSKDYSSTIINTQDNNSIMKNAIEEKAEKIDEAKQTLARDYSNENAKKLVEWYKYLGDKQYSTAVDYLMGETKNKDFAGASIGRINNNTIYEKNGRNYYKNSDGSEVEVTGNEIMVALTPVLGISLENEIGNTTPIEDSNRYSREIYDKFNFGLIKEKPTTTNLEKKITNVEFTNQVGTTLVSENPTALTSQYISSLETVTGGSKYAKLEIDPENIYGSSVKLTYEITISNDSRKDYIESATSDKYGDYFKYGTKTQGVTEAKKVTVIEVEDDLDEKFSKDSLPKTVKQTKLSSKEIELTPVKTTTQENGTQIEKTYISMTGWESLEAGEKTSASYTVTSLLAQGNDSSFGNSAQITKISLDKLTTLRSDFEWSADKTTFAITPSTGANRSYTELIVGIVALIIAGCGFILIKKKVL